MSSSNRLQTPTTQAASPEQVVEANGASLCTQTFGDPAHPAILLIAGTASSMDWWEDEFCERLAADGQMVIRYDYRDTGRSVSYPPGKPEYTLRDLAADAVGLLDRFGVDRAHLVGLSMGGWIAQLIALDHPDRVASLTLISTRTTGHGPSEPDLPEMTERLEAAFAKEAPEPDWSDRDAAIDYLVASMRPFAGSLPFDESAVRAVGVRVVDRTTNLAASMTNHVVAEQGDRWRERLGATGAPTLVIHGAEDPLFPLDHGRALAREIPGARLLVVDRMGHELPRAVWDEVIPAIVRHTATTQGANASSYDASTSTPS